MASIEEKVAMLEEELKSCNNALYINKNFQFYIVVWIAFNIIAFFALKYMKFKFIANDKARLYIISILIAITSFTGMYIH